MFLNIVRWKNVGIVKKYPLSHVQSDSVWRNGRFWAPPFETRLCHLDFPLGKDINPHCWVTLRGAFAGNGHWAEPSPLFALRARPTPLKCKNEYLVLALGEETVQALVGSIVSTIPFRRLK